MPTHVEPYETLEGALPHRTQAHASEADNGQALRTPVAVPEAARNEFGSLGSDGAWHVQDT
ncbi:hypothetical protein COCMIDRAFT_33639 [Bipolaris oryzae ATCC 44560]|uniref:Uncharacterized protein n=1 Tax=Bipolaris oryzae ATCC 44560 TaxID=930090 RepID=W6ZG12_COCMI|nr:uncharacterized protein COCMIDRAFT_33639 [Bipolaris oryzae ATCC 44560]EUC48970.1 hypothetical protein COCMIDRAFT_33639 [Bipolaris oryzae ATCC 44560]